MFMTATDASLQKSFHLRERLAATTKARTKPGSMLHVTAISGSWDLILD